MVAPAVRPDGIPACLSTEIDGEALTTVVGESVAVTAGPVGGVPEAVAVLGTDPASTSAWVSV